VNEPVSGYSCNWVSVLAGCTGAGSRPLPGHVDLTDVVDHRAYSTRRLQLLMLGIFSSPGLPSLPVCLTSLDAWPRPSWRRCVSPTNQRRPGNSSFYYGTPSREAIFIDWFTPEACGQRAADEFASGMRSASTGRPADGPDSRMWTNTRKKLAHWPRIERLSNSLWKHHMPGAFIFLVNPIKLASN